MTCFLSNSTGIPHLNELLETHRSCNPGIIKLLSISFFRECGIIKSGCSSKYLINLSAYFFILKKYVSSFCFFTSLPQSGHLPSFSCLSVQKDSHGVQYQSVYDPLYISPCSYSFVKIFCTWFL